MIILAWPALGFLKSPIMIKSLMKYLTGKSIISAICSLQYNVWQYHAGKAFYDKYI
jgi:hypothetical protein